MRAAFRALLAAATLLSAAPTLAGPIERVLDINRSIATVSTIGKPAALGSGWVLAMCAPNGTGAMYACQPWFTDGTDDGTHELSSFPSKVVSEFFVLGSIALFVNANPDMGFGSNIWRTDGTRAGTTKVASVIVTGPVAKAGNVVFFVSDTALWKTDGTSTTKVADIPAGVSSLTSVGNAVYFAASDASHGTELWRSDGTAAGTGLVKDIVPGPDGGSPSHLANIGGRLFFWARSRVDLPPTLWVSDGTDSGTVDAGTGLGPRFVSDMVDVNGFAYFTRDNGDGQVVVTRTGGTLNSTVDLYAWPQGLLQTPVLAGTTPYLVQYDTNGVQSVWGILGGAAVSIAGSAGAPTALTAVGSQLYFSDMSHPGTPVLRAIPVGSSTAFDVPAATTAQPWAAMGTRLIAASRILWLTDGTAAGTRPLRTAAWENNLGSSCLVMQPAILANGAALFPADDGEHGCELWRSDGTAAGTQLVKDLVGGESGSFRQTIDPHFVSTGLRAFFVAGNGSPNTIALWTSDGTAAGTLPLTNGFPIVEAMVTIGPSAYFIGRDNAGVAALWTSDGTPSGTAIVAPLSAAGLVPVSGSLTVFNGRLHFACRRGSTLSLCASDGTAAGTAAYFDFPATYDIDATRFVVGTSQFFLAASPPSQDKDVWRSDGTAGGTWKASSFVSGSSPGAQRLMGAVGDRVVFEGWDGSAVSIYSNDGTPSSNRILKRTGNLNSFGVAAGRMYFGDSFDFTLMATDGITATVAASRIYGMGAPVTAAGAAWLAANSQDVGNELWIGNRGSISLVQDYTPPTVGLGSTGIGTLMPLQDALVFMGGAIADAMEPLRVVFDRSPDVLGFIPQDRVAPRSSRVSNAVQVTGINVPVDVVATNGQICVSSVPSCTCNVAAYAATASVVAGQYVCARHVAAPTLLTSTTTTIAVGTAVASFTSTTGSVFALRTPDLDDDGFADLVWTNPAGASASWLMSGGGFHAANVIAPPADGAVVVRTGDFDGDGKTDLLWQTSGGAYWITLQDGLVSTASKLLLAGGTGWEVVAKGDFNGDGKTDLVWRGPTGEHRVALMNGTADPAYPMLADAALHLSVALVADFNGDGKSDIVWTGADGSATMFLMDGVTILEQKQLLGGGTGWSVIAYGDLNGDGYSDLLWRHADGRVGEWFMNGTTAWSYGSLLGAGTGWSVKLVRDFDGDGRSDLLWVNADGSHALWLMNGGTPVGYITLVGANSGWNVVASEDYDGDGKEDLLWRGPNGEYAMWLMDGIHVRAYRSLIGGGTGWDALP